MLCNKYTKHICRQSVTYLYQFSPVIKEFGDNLYSIVNVRIEEKDAEYYLIYINERQSTKMLAKLKQFCSKITVEPINLLFLVGTLSVEAVRQDFFLQTICRHSFPKDSVCDATSNYNKTVKLTSESQTATYISIWYICHFHNSFAADKN